MVKQLAAVRAGVHSLAKAEIFKGLGVEIEEIDYDKPETLEYALQGVERLLLLTPLSDRIVEMTSAFVETGKKSGVKYIVKLSVLDADSEKNLVFARWHREAERIVENSGIPYTHLRPNFFMQNHLIQSSATIKSQGAFYMALDNAKISQIDVRDIAAVAVKVLTEQGHENKAYNLTGSEALTFHELAEIFSEEIGKKVKYVPITDDAARMEMINMGMPDWLVDGLIELSAAFRAGYGSKVSSAVEQITGKRPRSFSQFVQDHIESFK